jgi:hypothetical protein
VLVEAHDGERRRRAPHARLRHLLHRSELRQLLGAFESLRCAVGDGGRLAESVAGRVARASTLPHPPRRRAAARRRVLVDVLLLVARRGVSLGPRARTARASCACRAPTSTSRARTRIPSTASTRISSRRRWPLVFHAGRATCAALLPCPSYLPGTLPLAPCDRPLGVDSEIIILSPLGNRSRSLWFLHRIR